MENLCVKGSTRIETVRDTLTQRNDQLTPEGVQTINIR